MSSKSTTNASSPPPWDVLVLVAHHLDPKTLAMASCVSKPWYISMSSDHIWQPLSITHYPSLSLLKFTNPFIPYRRLFTMAYTATTRRLKTPNKPQLSLEDLIFVINLSNKNNHPIINTAKPGGELNHRKEIFRFDIEINYESSLTNHEVFEDFKISWNLVLKGWRSVFTMMDCEGKLVRFGRGGEGWFSEELPSSECCSSDEGSGMVADLKLGFCSKRRESDENRKIRVEKVSVGILSIVNWRYVSVHNALRYLQHFLLP